MDLSKIDPFDWQLFKKYAKDEEVDIEIWEIVMQTLRKHDRLFHFMMKYNYFGKQPLDQIEKEWIHYCTKVKNCPCCTNSSRKKNHIFDILLQKAYHHFNPLFGERIDSPVWNSLQRGIQEAIVYDKNVYALNEYLIDLTLEKDITNLDVCLNDIFNDFIIAKEKLEPLHVYIGNSELSVKIETSKCPDTWSGKLGMNNEFGH